VGRPPIKPVETSYIPVVRAIPEAKRPPAAVRKVDAKELRQSRPLVKEQDRSAFRPQAKPAPLEVKKIEKPRPASERATERQQAVPKERRGPAASQKSPPQPPPEKVKPEPPPPVAAPEEPMPHAIEEPPVAILKSGVVDGMGYTLYVDGSIEAELPQGTLRFASINDLRGHLAKNS